MKINHLSDNELKLNPIMVKVMVRENFIGSILAEQCEIESFSKVVMDPVVEDL